LRAQTFVPYLGGGLWVLWTCVGGSWTSVGGPWTCVGGSWTCVGGSRNPSSSPASPPSAESTTTGSMLFDKEGKFETILQAFSVSFCDSGTFIISIMNKNKGSVRSSSTIALNSLLHVITGHCANSCRFCKFSIVSFAKIFNLSKPLNTSSFPSGFNFSFALPFF